MTPPIAADSPVLRLSRTALLMAALTLSATAGHAQQAACRLTQTINIAGQKIESDQCMQNNGMAADQFKSVCNTGSEGVPALGIPPMKVVFQAACPTKAVNVCEGFGQGKLTTYYYNKDADGDRKKGCEATGGKLK